MSKRSDAFVGAAGTKARNRGLSQEMTDVTILIGKYRQYFHWVFAARR